MKTIFKLSKAALLAAPDLYDPSKKLFKTVKLDKGQFDRIINDEYNNEFQYEFPAVFIHFIGVSYLVSQNRIGDGNGSMVVKFILNRLNDQDDKYEAEIFDYAGLANAAIQSINDSADIKRVTLQYFDMPSSSNQLQPCTLTYDVQFTDTSAQKYTDWIERTITTPTFTNRSDVIGEERPNVDISEYEDQVTVSDTLD